MSLKEKVVQGAICMCNFGTTPDKLKVLTQQKHFANDKDGSTKLIATNKYLGTTFEKNTFGSCKKTNNSPCSAIVTAWSGFYEKVTFEDNQGKILLEDSKATCPNGGKDCIKIINHGQIAEVSSQNVKNSDPIAQSIINPLVDASSLLDEHNNQVEFKIVKQWGAE